MQLCDIAHHAFTKSLRFPSLVMHIVLYCTKISQISKFVKAYCAISHTFVWYSTLCDIAQYVIKQIFNICWVAIFWAFNLLGPLEKLLVDLQGSTRSRWKGLSKTNIFMWYWCSLLLKVSFYYSMFDIEHSMHMKKKTLCAISNTAYNSLTTVRACARACSMTIILGRVHMTEVSLNSHG